MANQGQSHPEPTDEFLLTQFSVLSSHNVGLFNAATQRIAAYLVFAGLLLGSVGVSIDSKYEQGKGIFTLGALFGVGVVGLSIWERTVRLTIQTTRYFRIVNGIRGYFAKRDPTVARICTNILPTSGSLPKWNQPVFDAGLTIIEVILAITMALFVFNSPETIGVSLAPTYLTVATIVFAVMTWFVLQATKTKMLRTALQEETSNEDLPNTIQDKA